MNIHSKNILFFLIIILINISAFPQEININRIEMMPNFPSPYEMRDWKRTAVGYDSLVFNAALNGQYLPLIRFYNNTINYPEHGSFGLHTVVGTTSPTSGEAINVLPAVIGASLVGIDKSNQNGYNFVLMCEEWFNKINGELVYLNHPSASSGDDWWYETMPNIFFYQLYDLYPGTGDFNFQFSTVADRWLEAVDSMGARTTPWIVPYMNYRAWNLKTMKPLTTGVPEPEAAGAIAWILYNAFVETGNEKYRIGAEHSLEFLNGLLSNPSYELQLPYGVYTAARMNAEIGTNYNIDKLINWCFNIGSLRQWGAIVGNWGGYDAHGLIGESIDNDYAFLMNGFEQAGALVPLVRYDDRYARAIGKWMLNVSNASRLFYPNFLPNNNQDNEVWANQYDPNSYIGYEALREMKLGVSPYATGDAIDGGWGLTNLALYGSSHVGIFGGIIDTTNVQGILKLDVLKTDYFGDEAYPTFLFYNPHNSVQAIDMNVGTGIHDIYDAVTNTFLQTSVTGETSIQISADAASLIVIIPSGGTITYDLKKMLINGVVVDYNSSQNVSNFPPRIKSLSAKNNKLLLNASTQIFSTAHDLDNDELTYAWSVSGGIISGSGSQTTYNAPGSPGNYLLNCIVEDGKGGIDSAQIIIEVAESFNQAPVIERIKASPRKVDLNGESLIECFAFDPDGDSLNFLWEFSEGTLVGSGSSVSWTAPNIPGNYFIICSVDDGNGGTAMDSIGIVVRDFSNQQTGNLIAFYPFNGNANDESGNGNHGAVFQASLTSDRFNNPSSAYSFDGVNDRILIQNNSSLNFQNAISINFWIKIGEFFPREAYPISHGNWENRWKISITDKRIRWTIKTTTGVKDIDSETELIQASLYNVTAYYDGNDFDIYINGELDAFGSFSGQLLTTDIDMTIGQNLPNNNNYNFKGILDDIRIYDYALPFSEIISLYDISTSTDENLSEQIPGENYLYQNYPNPFNGQSIIKFDLAQSGEVDLIIYDILGKKIKKLVNKEMAAGSHSIGWNGFGDNGEHAASGVYFFELKSAQSIQRKKMIYLR
jgi:hypothetical protein